PSDVARSRVFLQLAAIQVDHAIGERVVQDRDGSWSLDDAVPAPKSLSLGAARQTLIIRTPFEVVLLALTSEVVDPRLRVGGVDTRRAKGTIPDAGQIRLAIGSARSGRCEVRFAVVSARNARSLPIQPLGPGRHRPDDQNERREKQPHIALRSRREIPSPLERPGW